MAQPTTSAQIAVRVAQHKIFNKLCIAFRRSRQDPESGVRADDVRRELDIPENIFVEALATFIDANAEMIVEVYEKNGQRYVRLGESARYNCSDWRYGSAISPFEREL